MAKGLDTASSSQEGYQAAATVRWFQDAYEGLGEHYHRHEKLYDTVGVVGTVAIGTALAVKFGPGLMRKGLSSALVREASGAERAAAKLGVESLEMLPKRARNLGDGSIFTIVNPKTGAKLETTVLARTTEKGEEAAFLFTRDQKEVAQVMYSRGAKEGLGDSVNFHYGNPPERKPFLWLDYMEVKPDFRGTGVREALVRELRDHSRASGLGGRVKLLADNDFGTVSAIPWYKAGFRPMTGPGLPPERLTKVSELLDGVVRTKMRLTLDQGKAFDALMMYLP